MSIINIFSPNWEEQDSYGRIAIELTRAFQTNGYHVNQFGDNAPSQQKICPSFGGLMLGYPTLYKEFYEDVYGVFAKFGSRIAITMFESTKLPNDWAENLNKTDAVILPAYFLTDIFRSEGVSIPLHVHPLGVSEEFLDAAKREKTQPFSFLAIADRGNRKNWKKVVYAFVRAFGDNPNYRLILKARNFQFSISNANIVQIGEDYSNEQMAELYRQCHVMVFPSCGEGFGLPPREFAATGGIAMVTNWGGLADDVADWGVPIPYSLCDAWSDKPDWYGKLGQWADVDVDMVANRMKLIDYNYTAYAERAMRAAKFVHQNYRWETFGEYVIKVWEIAANGSNKR